jgi:hypothetical protein
MQSQVEFQIQPPPGPDAPTDIRCFPGHPFQLHYKGVMLQPVAGIPYETVPARQISTPPAVVYRIPPYQVQTPVGEGAAIDIRCYPGHPHQLPWDGVMLQPVPGLPYETVAARYTTNPPMAIRHAEDPAAVPSSGQPKLRTSSAGTVSQSRQRQSRSPERRPYIQPIQSPMRGPTPGRNPPPVRPIYAFNQSRAPLNTPVTGSYVPMPITGTVQTRMSSAYTIPSYEQQQADSRRVQDTLMDVDTTQTASGGRRKPPPGMPPLHAPHHGVAPPDYPFGPLMQARPQGARAQRLWDQLAAAQKSERQLSNLPPVRSQAEAASRTAAIAQLHETLRDCFDRLAAAQAEEGYAGLAEDDDDPGRPRGNVG